MRSETMQAPMEMLAEVMPLAQVMVPSTSPNLSQANIVPRRPKAQISLAGRGARPYS
ncbi:hypothetical protein STANM309S_01096 [Streptomyces tanashiensis]